ncbi:MAG: methyl-accepting chemotaxis protein [Bdellovibrionales bacterium]|nr:methyl-accepting chemotaxis protein [Bdellovibrionales bacterium]
MNSWSLNKKIWAIIGILSVAFVFSTYFGLKSLMNTRDDLNEVTGKLVDRDQATSTIRDLQRRVTNLTAEVLLYSRPEQIAPNTKEYEEVLVEWEKEVQNYELIASDKGKELVALYRNLFKEYLVEIKKARELVNAGKNPEAIAVYIKLREERLAGLRAPLNDMNALTEKALAEKTELANSEVQKSITISSIIALASILGSILIAFFVLRAVSAAIAQVISTISDSSVQVSAASSQIASSSEQLSQSATEQAASLEETAASVEEMNSMVSKNSENANSAAATSGKSQEAVNQGKEVIQKMIASMEAINRSSEGMVETVKVIEQIDKKTKVINEIVNKTELLSFNASVEAARAGEHGKGFAVVAEEVGNLARMSGAAAEEIASLLEESINKVNQMVAETKKNVDTGAQVTRECGEVFEEVVQNVASVSGMATEIASASQEQSRGITEITKAMSQLDQMTQQNAATSEECASAAEELSAQAESLKNAIGVLVVTVNGGSAADSAVMATTPVKTASKKAAPAKAQANVVHLKAPKANAAPANGAGKKAAGGDVPHYDSNGFQDV